MKIFVGTAEIAGMMTFIAASLRQQGHEVTTFADNSGTGFYNHPYNIIIPEQPYQKISSNIFIRKAQELANKRFLKNYRKKIFAENQDNHDVYIFMWNGFLENSPEDFSYLKRKGKKIVSLFLGSDVRHVSAFAQEYQLDISSWEQWFHTTDLNTQLFRLRKAELYSDAIYSVHDQSGLAIRPYHKLYIPFKADAIEFKYPGRKIPKIVHVPSRSGIKGTAFVTAALDELKNEGIEFEFELISGVTNTVVLQKLGDADILVDELFLHGPGTLSLEGIASGCAVATKTLPGEIYDEVLCNVNLNTVKEGLKKLIINEEYRKQVAYGSVELIKKINDPLRIVNDFLTNALTGVTNQQFDYHPSFFSNNYSLPDGEKINSENKKLTKEIIAKYQLEDSLNVTRMMEGNLV